MSERGPLDFDDEREAAAPSPPGAPAPAPPPAPPPARPVGASRYGWFLGFVVFLLLVVVMLNSVRSEGVPPGGPEQGGRLVPFAVPLAQAAPREREDANVDGERACRVRGPDILNICQLAEQGPVVLALFPTGGDRCAGILRQFDRLAPRFPEVRFAAVGSGGRREELGGRRAYPVGWDKDRAVASVYGLVGCPQVTFARRGGDVVLSTRTDLTDAELAARIRELR